MRLGYRSLLASSVASTTTLRYFASPVPAGMSFPMMTFSLRPSSGSLLPSMAACVSTRVVSWKEAADSHDSVASDAFVIPMSSGRPDAGRLPSATASRFMFWYFLKSTSSPGSSVVSPWSTTVTLRSIWRTMTSMCLSWIGTPCERYTPCTPFTR